MTQQTDSLGYKNFNEKYASEQYDNAAEEVRSHERRMASLTVDLEEVQDELEYWQGVRDFYGKAKEAEQ